MSSAKNVPVPINPLLLSALFNDSLGAQETHPLTASLRIKRHHVVVREHAVPALQIHNLLLQPFAAVQRVGESVDGPVDLDADAGADLVFGLQDGFGGEEAKSWNMRCQYVSLFDLLICAGDGLGGTFAATEREGGGGRAATVILLLSRFVPDIPGMPLERVAFGLGRKVCVRRE